MSFNPVQPSGTGTHVASSEPLARTPAQKRTREESGMNDLEATTRVCQSVIDENGQVVKKVRISDASYSSESLDSSEKGGLLLTQIKAQNLSQATSQLFSIVEKIKGNAILFDRHRNMSSEERRRTSLPVPQRYNIENDLKELNVLMSDPIKFNNFIAHLGDQYVNEIVSFIDNCRKLVENAHIHTPIKAILSLVACLKEDSNLTAEQIGMIFKGLGTLARGDCLDNTVGSFVHNLLSSQWICVQEMNATNINEIIQGLGLLAQANCLSHVVDVSVINDLLTRLCLQTENTSTISTTCNGLGLLAQAKYLNGTLDATIFNVLLDQLNLADGLNLFEAHDFFKGLRLLVEAKSLMGRMDTIKINFLLIQCAQKQQFYPPYFSNLVYGLGLLAEGNHLIDNVDLRSINLFFGRLANASLQPQHFCELVCGLGLLVANNKLNREVDFPKCQIHTFLRNLSQEPLKAQQICWLLYGVSVIAQSESFDTKISTDELNVFLVKLLESGSHELSAKEVDILLDGLKSLHDADKIEGELDKEALIRILVRSSRFQPTFLALQCGTTDPDSIISLLPNDLIRKIVNNLLDVSLS